MAVGSARALSLQRLNRLGVFCITGGGSPLLSELLTTPGASKTVLEATVPYAGTALTDYLGAEPEQSCSETTARATAVAAFERARALVLRADASTAGKRTADRCFGFGCTASLATDRTKRGEHRAHVAVQTAELTLSVRYDFPRRGTRRSHEKLLHEAQWQVLAQALDLEDSETSTVGPEATQTTLTEARPEWRRLLLDRADSVRAAGFSRASRGQTPKLLLPGSFNPLHAGHRRMLEVAEAKLHVPGAFELAITNVDKHSLDYSTISERLAPFRGPGSAGRLWLTRLPTFIGKAREFPGVTFAVGADTIERIGMARYYGSQAACNKALDELAQLETRFLVFGRRLNGDFQTLADLKLPRRLRKLCSGVTEDEFRSDLSSTAHRRSAQH
ncbi:MAG: hypothetical protein AAGG11_00470 [Pseudomonadota bacterium]